MTRAKAHHIYVLPIFEELPMAGGYRDFVSGDLETNFGTHNIQFLTRPGIDACRKFWQDFVQALVAAHAPMDALFAYELVGEFAILNDLPPMDKTSGTYRRRTGQPTTWPIRWRGWRSRLTSTVFYAKAMGAMPSNR